MDPVTEEQNPNHIPLHPMVVLQPGERVVMQIKRHPFGILSLYIGAFFVLLVIAATLGFLLPVLRDRYADMADKITLIALALGGLGVVGVISMLFVSTKIYWQNQWVITTDSITQIIQTGLFDRQVSQLSMENIEDVTVDQDGVVQHSFNFGSLRVETAGERSKFVFAYCPNPNEAARQILDLHEKFLEDRRNVSSLRPTQQLAPNQEA